MGMLKLGALASRRGRQAGRQVSSGYYAGGYSSSFVPPSLVPSSSCSPSDLESLHPDPAEMVDPFQEQLLPPHPLPSSELLELALSSEKLSELVLLSQVGASTCIVIIVWCKQMYNGKH